MKKIIASITALALIITLLAGVNASASDTPSSWAKAEVDGAVAAKLVPAALQSKYTSSITRSDFCDLAVNLIEVQSRKKIADFVKAATGKDLSDKPFPDTASANVNAANKLGIVNGRTNGSFDPLGLITRQEAAKMLALTAKALGEDITASAAKFADDAKIASWAKEYVSFVFAKGVMNGTGNNNFSPAGYYTREQSMLTIFRLYKAVNGLPATSDDDYIKQFPDAQSLTVSDTKNDCNLTGLGVEWDPHFWRSFNTNKGCNEEDWNLIKSRAKELGIQKVRVMYLPGFIEPVNDNSDPNKTDLSKFTFNSTEFQSLVKEMEICQELGIEVNITIWGADHALSSWLAFPNCSDWITAPNDPDEYAENASVLFNYLINTKGFTCVKEITIQNEPDWAFKNDDKKIDFNYYAEVCRTTHERFIKDGLHDKVKFILSDDTFNQSWLVKCLYNLSDIADGYDSHCYKFGMENNLSQMYDWALGNNDKVRTLDPGKPYTHNEFGSNKTVGAYHQKDIDDYERGILYAMQATSFLDAGSSGMLSWIFFDQFYYDGARKDALMEIGLFGYKDEDWKVRPVYHAWGLMMKHTKIGMEIYPVNSEDNTIGAVALKSGDGKWTYIIVNSGYDDANVKISNAQINGASLSEYVYSQDTVTTSDKLIASSGTLRTIGSDTYVKVGSMSFVVLSNLN